MDFGLYLQTRPKSDHVGEHTHRQADPHLSSAKTVAAGQLKA